MEKVSPTKSFRLKFGHEFWLKYHYRSNVITTDTRKLQESLPLYNSKLPRGFILLFTLNKKAGRLLIIQIGTIIDNNVASAVF